jgi:hypothetical protein
MESTEAFAKYTGLLRWHPVWAALTARYVSFRAWARRTRDPEYAALHVLGVALSEYRCKHGENPKQIRASAETIARYTALLRRTTDQLFRGTPPFRGVPLEYDPELD